MRIRREASLFPSIEGSPEGSSASTLLGGEMGKLENSPEMSIISLASFWKASMLVEC